MSIKEIISFHQQLFNAYIKGSCFQFFCSKSSDETISKMENEFEKRGVILNEYNELRSWYSSIFAVDRLIASMARLYHSSFILRSIIAKIGKL